MNTPYRAWILGAGFLVLGMALFMSEQLRAGDNKDLIAAVQKIAASIKKGDASGAQKMAAALDKKVIEEVGEAMGLFGQRKRGGLGVGKEGTVLPDGIELKLTALEKDVANLDKEAEALEQMGYHIAAIMEVAIVKAPKDEPKKLKKDFIAKAVDTRNAALDLAKAAKAKNAKEIKAAAVKIGASCTNCHNIFQ